MAAFAPTSGATSSYGELLGVVRRRAKLTIALAAALIALVLLVGGGLSALLLASAPGMFLAVLVTLIVGGGVALARAWVGFEWAATQIERALANGKISSSGSVQDDDQVICERALERTETWYLSALVLATVTVCMFLAGVWTTVL